MDAFCDKACVLDIYLSRSIENVCSEAFDQPARPRSLFKVFAVLMKKHWILGGCIGGFEFLLGAQKSCYFVSLILQVTDFILTI